MPKSLYYGPEEIRAKSTIHFTDIDVNAYDKTIAEEAALSNDFASNKGKLAWPVAYTSIVRN